MPDVTAEGSAKGSAKIDGKVSEMAELREICRNDSQSSPALDACYGQIGISARGRRRAVPRSCQESAYAPASNDWRAQYAREFGLKTYRRGVGMGGMQVPPFRRPISSGSLLADCDLALASRVSHTSNAAKTVTTTPIATSTIMASLFWNPSSHGDTISPIPARRRHHSSRPQRPQARRSIAPQ